MQAYKAQEGNELARLRMSLKLTGFRRLLENYMSSNYCCKEETGRAANMLYREPQGCSFCESSLELTRSFW